MAIAYLDAGFGADAGLREAALELRPAVGRFAAATDIGTAGLTAPATGFDGFDPLQPVAERRRAAGAPHHHLRNLLRTDQSKMVSASHM